MLQTMVTILILLEIILQHMSVDGSINELIVTILILLEIILQHDCSGFTEVYIWVTILILLEIILQLIGCEKYEQERNGYNPYFIGNHSYNLYR